ncbi:hypothetical protein VNI00_004018 [Paramarasmius palmivorus]|uniref:Uncharacterized protein n=1 Tax=Paramarasmius palmivorus TaxID=297713 RepID=A0AAW0DQQ7_9AGAR
MAISREEILQKLDSIINDFANQDAVSSQEDVNEEDFTNECTEHLDTLSKLVNTRFPTQFIDIGSPLPPPTLSPQLPSIDDEATRRIDLIIQNPLAKEPITKAEHLEYLETSRGSREQLEDAALGRLLRIYDPHQTWACYSLAPELGSLINVQAELIDIHPVSPTEALNISEESDQPLIELTDIHIRLCKVTNSTRTNTLEYHAARTLGTIYFAHTFKKYTSGKGGDKRKQEFYEMCFIAFNEHLFENVEGEERRLMIHTEHEREFEEWKKKNALDVAGRNRLLKVYHALGYGIFLDPFWRPDNLHNNARTVPFKLLLEQLPTRISRNQDSVTQTEATVRAVMGAMGGGFLKDYDDLIAIYPSHVTGATTT